MANLTRVSKSGSKWTLQDLTTYNIRIETEDAPTFFEIPELPPPTATPAKVLVVENKEDAPDGDAYWFIRQVGIVTSFVRHNSKIVVDFTRYVIRMTGYNAWGKLMGTEVKLPMIVCGKKTSASMDGIIINEHNEIIFILREIRGATATDPGRDPEPQLLAAAIAAFTHARDREEPTRRKPLQSRTYAAIAVAGSSPIFYKIPITAELVDAVASGTYPEKETVIHRLYPPVPRPERRLAEGMVTLDHRRVILACFEAFQKVINANCHYIHRRHAN